MAEEKEKKEELEEPEELEGQEGLKKKGLPIKMIIIPFLGLFLVGGVFFLFKSGLLSKSTDNSAISIEEQDSKPEIGPIYSMDSFIVNLIGDQGKSYLKARLELELSNPKLREEIDKRLPQFRDTILTLLSSKTRSDIKTLEGKFQLREEIISMLNQYLSTGKILNIYFTDFIIQ